MEKPATTTYPVHEIIRRRWSPRAFDKRAVPADVLRSVLEAARWAASCFGEEPWRYIIALRDNAEEFQTLLSCLVEKNQQWAQGAPVLMIGCTKKTFTRGGRPNRHAVHDLGLASAQLTLEATARGLFVHQMAGIQPDRVREIYGVPEDFEIVTGLALGYGGTAESLPESFRASEVEPRRRRPHKELFFSKLWDEPPDFFKKTPQD